MNISTDSNVGAAVFLPHNDIDKWAETIISGVEFDEAQLQSNLELISTQSYINKIRRIYEQDSMKSEP